MRLVCWISSGMFTISLSTLRRSHYGLANSQREQLFVKIIHKKNKLFFSLGYNAVKAAVKLVIMQMQHGEPKQICDDVQLAGSHSIKLLRLRWKRRMPCIEQATQSSLAGRATWEKNVLSDDFIIDRQKTFLVAWMSSSIARSASHFEPSVLAVCFVSGFLRMKSPQMCSTFALASDRKHMFCRSSETFLDLWTGSWAWKYEWQRS